VGRWVSWRKGWEMGRRIGRHGGEWWECRYGGG
jgi:hypothetical protein